VSVAQSGYATCALKSSGEIWCWGGSGIGGELGNGTTDTSQSMVRVSGSTAWTALLESGPLGSFAMGPGGTVWAWGTWIPFASTVPTQVEAASGPWKTFTAGYGQWCGLKSDDTLWCGGDNPYGQTGIPTGWKPFPVMISF
jgi:hypothetical protein